MAGVRAQQMRVSGADMCALDRFDIDPSQRPIEYARLQRGKSTLLSVKPCSCMAAMAMHLRLQDW